MRTIIIFNHRRGLFKWQEVQNMLFFCSLSFHPLLSDINTMVFSRIPCRLDEVFMTSASIWETSCLGVGQCLNVCVRMSLLLGMSVYEALFGLMAEAQGLCSLTSPCSPHRMMLGNEMVIVKYVRHCEHGSETWLHKIKIRASICRSVGYWVQIEST